MADELCLTVLLKQANLDLRAAHLQHEAILQCFPLDAEDRRILSMLTAGTTTPSEVAQLFPDASRVLIVFWENQQYERFRSHAEQFLKSPLAVHYQNAEYAIQKVYRDKAAEEAVPVTQSRNAKSSRRDVIGYQLAIFILVCASVLLALRYGSASSEVEQLQAQLEEQYHDRYEEGYADAESTAYESGYDAGCKDGYSTGYADGDADGRSAILSAYYKELRFFRNGACIVTEEGYRYHHYGCYHIAGREYWIYNTELAEYKGYSPCLDCWENELLTLILP